MLRKLSSGVSEPLTLTQVLTSSVASGSNAISLTAGARISLGGCYIADSSSQVGISNNLKILNNNQGISYSAYGVINNGSTNTTPASTTSLTFSFFTSDIANGVLYSFEDPTTLATNNNTFAFLRARHTTGGTPVTIWTLFGNGRMAFDSTDSSGTPGAVTLNKPSGKVAIAAGASSVVVTNSCVSATSIVLPVLQTTDATLTFIKSCVPSAGSFTVTGNANATAAVTVGFLVIN